MSGKALVVALPPVRPAQVVTVRRKRTEISIRRMLASRRRNAREARRQGKPYGPGQVKGGKSIASRRPYKRAGALSRAGAGEASAYLREARKRALALVLGGVPEVATVLGLIDLAQEALGTE